MSFDPRKQLAEIRQRAQKRDRQALIIAPGQHKCREFDLKAVSKDAEAIKNLLVDPDCGCFPKGNVDVLEGEKASIPEIRVKLGSLSKKAGKDGLTFILFIGHAVVTEYGPCFITHETNPDSIQDTALSKSLLSELMGRFKTNSLLVVFDCCHAGGFADILPQRIRAVPTPEDLFLDYTGEGRVLLAAAGHDQKAVEHDRGLLSLALEEGLGGKADRDNKGVVTVEDLEAYVKSRVSELGHQEPKLTGHFTQGFALTLNRERVRQLVSEVQVHEQARNSVDQWGSRTHINPHWLTDQEQEVILAILEHPDAHEDDPGFQKDKQCLRDLVLQHRSDTTCPMPIKQLARHVELQRNFGPASKCADLIRALRTKDLTQKEQLDEQRDEARRAQSGLTAALADAERCRAEAHELRQKVAALSERIEAAQREADELRRQAGDWQAKAAEAGERATRAAAEAESARKAHALVSSVDSEALARAKETAAIAEEERRRLAKAQHRIQSDLTATQEALKHWTEKLLALKDARDAAESRASEAETQLQAAFASQQQLAASEAVLSQRLNKESRRTSSLRRLAVGTTLAGVGLAITAVFAFDKVETIRQRAGSALADLDKAREENRSLLQQISDISTQRDAARIEAAGANEQAKGAKFRLSAVLATAEGLSNKAAQVEAANLALEKRLTTTRSDLAKAQADAFSLSNTVEALRKPVATTREIAFTAPFTNSLCMRFAPVPGVQALFSVWETRVQDYEAFAKTRSGGDTLWRNPVFQGVAVTPGPTHPVVNVSWNDAKDFCEWLTVTERRAGVLPADRRYRLPTDMEWSAAVGLPNEQGATPRDRDVRIPGVYPWGKSWPPPTGAGNFADVTFKKQFGGIWEVIEGYIDGHAVTAPVGSFAASRIGLHDLAGNVWEWCADWYDTNEKNRVVRGGSWLSVDRAYLLSSYRNFDEPDVRNVLFGFRVVLGVEGSAR